MVDEQAVRREGGFKKIEGWSIAKNALAEKVKFKRSEVAKVTDSIR